MKIPKSHENHTFFFFYRLKSQYLWGRRCVSFVSNFSCLLCPLLWCPKPSCPHSHNLQVSFLAVLSFLYQSASFWLSFQRVHHLFSKRVHAMLVCSLYSCSCFLILSFVSRSYFVSPKENRSIFISATSICHSCAFVTATASIPCSIAGLIPVL